MFTFPEACWGGADCCRGGGEFLNLGRIDTGGISESSVILSNDVADMYN